MTENKKHSTIYELIESLCKEKGTSPTKLCTETTGSRGNLPTWQKGNINPVSLIKIADYFGVSADYLLGRTDNPEMNSGNSIKTGNINNSKLEHSLNISTPSVQENEFSNIMLNLSPREQTELMMIIYQFADEHKKED